MDRTSILTRSQAVQLGYTKYNNGQPCPKGHDPCYRWTATYQCVECCKRHTAKARGKVLINQAKNRSGYALIERYVNKATYAHLIQYIDNINRLMGVPDSVNAPLVEQDTVGLPREWADNPFDRAPAKLPVADIEHYLKQHHANGRFLDVTMDALTGRCWPDQAVAPVTVHTPAAGAQGVPTYDPVDPEERHF